jgi:hypothetical protein
MSSINKINITLCDCLYRGLELIKKCKQSFINLCHKIHRCCLNLLGFEIKNKTVIQNANRSTIPLPISAPKDDNDANRSTISLPISAPKDDNDEIFILKPQFTNLFAITQNEDLDKLRAHIQELGREGAKQLMKNLFEDYCDFLRWLKVQSRKIEMESDIEKKNQQLLKKSEIMQKVHDQYYILIYQIITAYPDSLKDILCNWKDKYNSLLVFFQVKGMQIMIDHFRQKNKFSGEWCAYDSYRDFENKLVNLNHDFSHNEWYFSIRCKESMISSNHQLLISIVRENDGRLSALIIDSGGFNTRLNVLVPIVNILYEKLPKIEMYSTLYSRQLDFFNCGFFTLKDMKKLAENKKAVWDHFKTKGKKAIEFQGHFPDKNIDDPTSLQLLLKNNPDSIKNLHLIDDVPLELMLPIQSLSKVNSVLKNPPENSSPDSLKKLIESKSTYSMIEAKSNKEVYLYTKLKANKYRLQVMSHLLSSNFLPAK